MQRPIYHRVGIVFYGCRRHCKLAIQVSFACQLMAPKLAQAACASIKDTFVIGDAAPLWRLYKVGEPDLWKDHHRYLHELRAKEVILSA